MNNSPDGRPPAYRAVITGYGSFAPAKTLTNDELGKMVDTTNEWIATRTGIKVRHIASNNETTALLATEAAKKALAQADLDASELDTIIVATITPPLPHPSYSGPLAQKRRGSLIWLPPAVALYTACR